MLLVELWNECINKRLFKRRWLWSHCNFYEAINVRISVYLAVAQLQRLTLQLALSLLKAAPQCSAATTRVIKKLLALISASKMRPLVTPWRIRAERSIFREDHRARASACKPRKLWFDWLMGWMWFPCSFLTLTAVLQYVAAWFMATYIPQTFKTNSAVLLMHSGFL